MNKLLILAVVIAGGCGLSSPDAASIVRSDSAGVEVVMNHGADQLLNWRFEPGWVVGGVGDERLQLSRLTPDQVGVDRVGRVYLLDTVAKQVLVFSAEGVLVETFGREGGGPGELLRPATLAVGLDDVVAVSDRGKSGLVRWSADREPLAEVRLELRYWARKFRLTTAGAILIGTSLREDRRTESELMLLGAGREQLLLGGLIGPLNRNVEFPTCDVQLVMAPLFATTLNWDAAGDRVVVNHEVAYEIDSYEDGQRVRSVRRALAPRPVDERMALREAGDGVQRPDCTIPPAEWLGRGYMDVLPSVAALAISPEGEIWALRGRIADEPSLIDVFASDGTYRGTLPDDTPFPVGFLPGGQMIALDQDSLDVPRITLYAITRTCTSGQECSSQKCWSKTGDVTQGECVD